MIGHKTHGVNIFKLVLRSQKVVPVMGRYGNGIRPEISRNAIFVFGAHLVT